MPEPALAGTIKDRLSRAAARLHAMDPVPVLGGMLDRSFPHPAGAPEYEANSFAPGTVPFEPSFSEREAGGAPARRPRLRAGGGALVRRRQRGVARLGDRRALPLRRLVRGRLRRPGARRHQGLLRALPRADLLAAGGGARAGPRGAGVAPRALSPLHLHPLRPPRGHAAGHLPAPSPAAARRAGAAHGAAGDGAPAPQRDAGGGAGARRALRAPAGERDAGAGGGRRGGGDEAGGAPG